MLTQINGCLITAANSFRTFNLDSPITSADASDLVVLEAVISNYDLSKTWDENSDGSYSSRRAVSLQNSTTPVLR